MSYGLRCWDSNGNVIQEVTDRLTRVIQLVTVNTLEYDPATNTHNAPKIFNVTVSGTIYCILSLDQDPQSELVQQDGISLTLKPDIVIDQNNRTVKVSDIKGTLIIGVY